MQTKFMRGVAGSGHAAEDHAEYLAGYSMEHELFPAL